MILITRQLWQAIRQPQRQHAVHNHLVERKEMIPFLFELAEALSLFALTSLYGLLWAMSISATVAAERESRRFDLLTLTPGGGLGTALAISTACIHRKKHWERANSTNPWIARGVAVIMLSGCGLISINDPSDELGVITFWFYVGTFVVGFYIDHVHSIILGVLTGLTLGRLVETRADARLWTPIIYLLMQVTTYVIFVLVGFFSLPAVYDALNFSGTLATISILLLRLGVLYGIREVIILGLWRLFAEQYNTDLTELALSIQRK